MKVVVQRPSTTVLVTAVVAAVEGLQGYGVSLLTPDIATTLSVGFISLVSARLLALMLRAALPLLVPTATSVWFSRLGAVGCAAALAATGAVKSESALVGLLCLVAAFDPGITHRASIVTAQTAPEHDVLTYSTWSAMALLLQLLFALGIAVGVFGTWQRAFEISGAACLAMVSLAAVLLRPAPRPVDTASAPDESAPRWRELSRSWVRTPSLIGLGIAVLVAAMLMLPFDAVLSIFLHSRWHLGLRGTAVVFSVQAGVSLVAVVAMSNPVAQQSADSPRRLAVESWCALAGGSLLLAAGVLSPYRSLMVVGVALGTGAIACLLPILAGLALSVVPPEQRAPMSTALASTMSVGSLIGIVYATSFANRHGPRVTLVALAALALAAAVIVRTRLASLTADQDRVREVGAWRLARSEQVLAGTRPPLLECRDIDFSYGSLQVLFGVDLTIDEGEVVALLGTNGAGKSTLLKVISGIGLPQRGTVRLSGRDITFIEAEERVTAGITQVPGGRAVFGSMTVVENLQSFGYTLGRDRRAVDEAIERCLDAFPRLGERKSSLAATLSGGEQQMVGLSKALILKPRLLLIDELSLGLAPVAVGPLLDLVRRINADGTAVVIVEQSINIALSLVDHAYFMEKGTIRFDGRASDLLDRQDLLRAVFLEGAAKGELQ